MQEQFRAMIGFLVAKHAKTRYSIFWKCLLATRWTLGRLLLKIKSEICEMLNVMKFDIIFKQCYDAPITRLSKFRSFAKINYF